MKVQGIDLCRGRSTEVSFKSTSYVRICTGPHLLTAQHTRTTTVVRIAAASRRATSVRPTPRPTPRVIAEQPEVGWEGVTEEESSTEAAAIV